MQDRETRTIWAHLDGRATRGPLQGQRMKIIALPQMTWGEWKRAHKDTLVLSNNTTFKNQYRRFPIGDFDPREALYGDKRLPANALVVGVEVNGQYKAYPVDALSKAAGILNDEINSLPIVVFFDASAKTGLAYSRVVGGKVLEFAPSETNASQLKDKATGNLWDLQGRCVSQGCEGASLQFIPSFISEWYGWSAYHPDTALYQIG